MLSVESNDPFFKPEKKLRFFKLTYINKIIYYPHLVTESTKSLAYNSIIKLIYTLYRIKSENITQPSSIVGKYICCNQIFYNLYNYQNEELIKVKVIISALSIKTLLKNENFINFYHIKKTRMHSSFVN